jgi:hypothetical protein
VIIISDSSDRNTVLGPDTSDVPDMPDGAIQMGFS